MNDLTNKDYRDAEFMLMLVQEREYRIKAIKRRIIISRVAAFIAFAGAIPFIAYVLPDILSKL